MELIEAAYRLDLDDRAWLEGIVRAHLASPDRMARWREAAPHLAAAFQLRSRAPARDLDIADDPARPPLPLRELAREVAVGCGSRADSMEIWRALASGAWSLVDRFDSEGKHLLLARKNDRTKRRALTARESASVAYAALGYSNHDIGRALDISSSTVSVNLARAARKTGLRSTPELIHLFRALLTTALTE